MLPFVVVFVPKFNMQIDTDITVSVIQPDDPRPHGSTQASSDGDSEQEYEESAPVPTGQPMEGLAGEVNELCPAAMAVHVPPVAPSDVPGIEIVVRLPDGSRAVRRIAVTERVSGIFAWLDVDFPAVRVCRLVAAYPRRVLSRGETITLDEIGLKPPSEAFHVEEMDA